MMTPIERAAQAIDATSSGLIVATGAGMGVDSGLPDFRGTEGFWRAYPPIKKRKIRFEEMANPAWFDREPEFAWGFYGHRLNLYRNTQPHLGFDLIHSWADKFVSGVFVFTSNVDGQFQKAGFSEDKIHECHGSIHHLQCTQPCCDQIWSAKGFEIEVNEETLTATTPLPKCPYCGSLARPNILLFGDMRWVSGRAAVQHDEQEDWVAELTDSPVIIECGAGTHVPSVRYFSQQMVRRTRATLIRINPREAEVPPNHVSIALPALEAIEQINETRSRAGAS